MRNKPIYMADGVGYAEVLSWRQHPTVPARLQAKNECIEMLEEIVSALAEMEPFCFDGASHRCYYCGGVEHKADCLWVKAVDIAQNMHRRTNERSQV